MIPQDKANHYILGQIVSVICLVFLGSLAIAYAAVVIVGVGKEIKDMLFKGTPEPLDALFTVAGGLVPILLVLFL